jgi:hypothetical protein
MQLIEHLVRFKRQVESKTLEPAQEHPHTLNRMLSRGVCRYLKQPVPKCISEEHADATRLRHWNRDVLQDGTARHNEACPPPVSHTL